MTNETETVKCQTSHAFKVLPPERNQRICILCGFIDIDNEMLGNDDYKEFKEWHNGLMIAALKSGKYGMDHPIGSSLMRDLFRDENVKWALEKAWKKYVVEGLS